MNLLGTTVLITGASGGIGSATARAFAAEGAKVVLTARSKERLIDLAKSIGEGRAIAVSADITNPLHVEELIKKADEKFGSIDILINNAAVGLISDVSKVSSEDLISVLNVNLLGPLHTIQKTLPVMKRNGGGIIINVSSMITRIATTGSGGYRASKMALNALSDALRIELKDDKIRVITVYPGLTSGNFFSNSLGSQARSNSSFKESHFHYRPEQVANRIVYACKKEPREVYMNLRGKIGGLAAQLFPGFLEYYSLLKKRYL